MAAKIVLLLALFTGLARADRVFELRTYTCADGKLEALEANFREHTIALLKRHGIESVAYWVARAPKNTLVFVLAYPSIEAAKQSWAAFLADPEWKQVAAATLARYGDVVTHVDSVFMNPTDFSPLK